MVESTSVKIEEPEVNLIQTTSRTISTKNFGTEARASLDVQHFLNNAIIRANIKDRLAQHLPKFKYFIS